jgi:hypothetical protein
MFGLLWLTLVDFGLLLGLFMFGLLVDFGLLWLTMFDHVFDYDSLWLTMVGHG